MLVFALVLLLVMVFFGLIFMMNRILSLHVTSATKHLDEMSQEMTKKELEITQRLEEAKQKSEEILGRAKQEADEARAKTISDAEAERDNIVKAARAQSEDIMQQADKSRQILLGEIAERVDKEAINKACELIQYTLPEKFKMEVHSHSVGELIQNAFDELGKLQIPDGADDIKITSAYPLEPEQRKIINKKMKELLGVEAQIKEEIDPAIVTGLVISIGSLILDGSLKNKIRQQAKGISDAGPRT